MSASATQGGHNKQTPLRTSIALRYATPVDNHHHHHHHLGYCTHSDGAEADAAGRLEILLRSGLEIVYDKKRSGHVDARVLVEHLKVGHASTVVAERVTDAATHGKGRTHALTVTSLTHIPHLCQLFFPATMCGEL